MLHASPLLVIHLFSTLPNAAQVTFDECLVLALESYSEAHQARAQAAILHPIVGNLAKGPRGGASHHAAVTPAPAAVPVPVVKLKPAIATITPSAAPLVSPLPSAAASMRPSRVAPPPATVAPFAARYPATGAPTPTVPVPQPYMPELAAQHSLLPPLASSMSSQSYEDDFEFSTADLKAQLLGAGDESEEEEEGVGGEYFFYWLHALSCVQKERVIFKGLSLFLHSAGGGGGNVDASASAGWFSGAAATGASAASPRKPDPPIAPLSIDSLPLLKSVPEDYSLNPSLCVACYGLNSAMTKSDINMFFKGCNISVGDAPEFASKIHFLRGPDAGAAFVQFETVSDWERAIARDAHLLHDKYRLRVVRAVGLHTTPTGQSFRLKAQTRNIDPAMASGAGDKPSSTHIIERAGSGTDFAHFSPMNLAPMPGALRVSSAVPVVDPATIAATAATPTKPLTAQSHLHTASAAAGHSLLSLLNTAQDDIVRAPRSSNRSIGAAIIGPSTAVPATAAAASPSAAAHQSSHNNMHSRIMGGTLGAMDDSLGGGDAADIDDMLNDETFSSSPVQLGAFDSGMFTSMGGGAAPHPQQQQQQQQQPPLSPLGAAQGKQPLRSSGANLYAGARPPPGLANFGPPPGLGMGTSSSSSLPPGLYRNPSPLAPTSAPLFLPQQHQQQQMPPRSLSKQQEVIALLCLLSDMFITCLDVACCYAIEVIT